MVAQHLYDGLDSLIAECFGADQKLGRDGACSGFACERGGMDDAYKKQLGEQKEETGDREEECDVAEVGDAGGRIGGRGAFRVGEEHSLVFGADWRTEDWHGDGGFF